MISEKFYDPNEDSSKDSGVTPPESPYITQEYADDDGSLHNPSRIDQAPRPRPPIIKDPKRLSDKYPSVPPPPNEVSGGGAGIPGPPGSDADVNASNIIRSISGSASAGRIIEYVNSSSLRWTDKGSGVGTPTPAREAGLGLTLTGNTLSVSNPFTESDEAKLDSLEVGGEANVQANWSESDVNSDAYIVGKPENLTTANGIISVVSGSPTAGQIPSFTDLNTLTWSDPGTGMGGGGDTPAPDPVDLPALPPRPNENINLEAGRTYPGLDIDDEYFYVLDFSGLIRFYGLDGDPKTDENITISTSGSWVGITKGKDPNGYFWLIGSDGTLLVLGSDGSVISSLGGVGLRGISSNWQGITNDGSFLYILDEGNRQIIAWNMQSNSQDSSRTLTLGPDTGNTGISTDGFYLYILNNSQNRIKCWLLTSRERRLSRDVNIFDGNWQGIAADGEFFYVVDTSSHFIKVFYKDVTISQQSILGAVGGEPTDGQALSYNENGSLVWSDVLTLDSQIEISKKGDATLYMVGDGLNALLSLDPATGVATRIGSAVGFGGQEFGPLGLSSHNGTLYMVGYGRGALYSLDVNTGVATRIGSAVGFGVRESVPSGLSSHNGTLYMLGSSNGALYSLDVDTGIATRIGSATNFGVNENSPSGLSSHNGILYVVGQTIRALFSLNPATGVATRIGSATDFGVNGFFPQGLSSHNGILYVVGIRQNALYSLDVDTGIATRIGSATNFGVGEGTPTGLASYSITSEISDTLGNILKRVLESSS